MGPGWGPGIYVFNQISGAHPLPRLCYVMILSRGLNSLAQGWEAGFLDGDMTGAGKTPNQTDFLALDRHGRVPAPGLGAGPGRRHSGAIADGPDSVRPGVFEDRPLGGQCAPPRGI